MDPKTQTKQDAFLRVLNAKMGCLANKPSDTYLYELQRQLYIWIDEVNAKIGENALEADRAEKARLS